METKIRGYTIYRHLYGYLCHDGFNYDDLGWYRLEDIAKKGVSPVWFKTKTEAANWRQRLPLSKKGWFGAEETEVREIGIRIRTEAHLEWD